MTRDEQIRFWVIGLGLFGLVLYLLRSVLTPFAAGMAAAYMLDPLADRLEDAGVSRLWATILITLGFVLVLVLALVVLLPLVQSQILAFLPQAPGYAEALIQRGQAWMQGLEDILGPERMAALVSDLESSAGEAVKWGVSLLKSLLSGGVALVSLVSLLVITPVITFYMLRDWNRMVETIDRWLPRPYAPTIRHQMSEINRTISGFIRGQATVCLALGTFYAVGLSLAGLELGMVVGLISGLLSFIPYVGTITGFVLSMGLALAQFDSWIDIGIIAGIFVAGQVVEGNYLTPKLVGDRVGLHPVWVIFALLAGGGLFGFLGILLAVPVAAVIGVLVRFSLSRYQESALFTGEPPFYEEGEATDGGPGPTAPAVQPPDHP